MLQRLVSSVGAFIAPWLSSRRQCGEENDNVPTDSQFSQYTGFHSELVGKKQFHLHLWILLRRWRWFKTPLSSCSRPPKIASGYGCSSIQLSLKVPPGNPWDFPWHQIELAFDRTWENFPTVVFLLRLFSAMIFRYFFCPTKWERYVLRFYTNEWLLSLQVRIYIVYIYTQYIFYVLLSFFWLLLSNITIRLCNQWFRKLCLLEFQALKHYHHHCYYFYYQYQSYNMLQLFIVLYIHMYTYLVAITGKSVTIAITTIILMVLCILFLFVSISKNYVTLELLFQHIITTIVTIGTTLRTIIATLRLL